MCEVTTLTFITMEKRGRSQVLLKRSYEQIKPDFASQTKVSLKRKLINKFQ